LPAGVFRLKLGADEDKLAFVVALHLQNGFAGRRDSDWQGRSNAFFRPFSLGLWPIDGRRAAINMNKLIPSVLKF